MPFNKSKDNGQGVQIYGHCLICTCPIETNRHGIKPNPDSFSRFLKVLSSSSRSTDPLNLTGDAQGDPNSSLSVSTEVPRDYDNFIKSPLIVLCFTCHDKLIELNETYSKLEKIQSQLIKLRNEVQVQLLIPYSSTQAVGTKTESLIEFLSDFGTLRQTIVNRLGISQTTPVVPINLNEILPPGVNNADLQIKLEEPQAGMEVDGNEEYVVHHQNLETQSEEDYSAFGKDSDGDSESDYLPHSEDDHDANSGTELVNQSFPHVSTDTDPDMNIQICRVELGKRIDEVLPVSSWTSSTTALVPKEIFDAITTRPWSKFRAITHAIYDCTYPQKCPIEGCTSERLYKKSCYRAHIVKVHLDKRFPNSIVNTNCKKIFKRKTGLEDSFVHNNNSQERKVSKPNPSKSKSKGRYKVALIECNICGKHLTNNGALAIHLKRHNRNLRYICRAQSCSKGFVVSYERKNHERSKHWEELGLEPIQCQICGKYYSSTTILSAHTQTHAGNFKHSCDQCDYKTQIKNDLEEHKATVHQSEYPWTCEVCGKSYKLERQLKKHKLAHEISKPIPSKSKSKGSTLTLIQCHICGKNLSSSLALTVHLNRHSGNAKYICRAQSCPKRFVVSNARLNHERYKHWEELGLEPIQCKICGKHYATTTILSAHQQTHTGNFKHSCDQCDYKTQTKKVIEEHIATVHGSERPWTCEGCGKSYKLKRQLAKHKLRHKSVDELFPCDICTKSFGTKYQLRVHKEKIHSINTGVIVGSRMEGI